MKVSRSGFTLIEVVVSFVILAVILSSSVSLLAALAAQRSSAWRETMAVIELGNVMERARRADWGELDASVVDKWLLPDDARRFLPNGSLAIQIEVIKGQPESKRILVGINWQATNGGPTSEVQGVIWRYRHSDGSDES